jgi:hypothetical protein
MRKEVVFIIYEHQKYLIAGIKLISFGAYSKLHQSFRRGG